MQHTVTSLSHFCHLCLIIVINILERMNNFIPIAILFLPFDLLLVSYYSFNW